MSEHSSLSRLREVETADGSSTLVDDELGVSYRSLGGANTESKHVFLDGTRLREVGDPWTVVELGLGTGTNFATTYCAARRAGVALVYHAVEWRPLPPSRSAMVDADARRLLREVLSASGPVRRAKDTIAQLVVHAAGWAELEPLPVTADAIYHDPFAPSANPSSWTEACFRWHRSHLAPGGRLATYSSAGAVRRALVDAGFHVRKRPGCGGKREVTVAAIDEAALEGEPW